MTGTLTDLKVAARLFTRATRRRLSGNATPHPDLDRFQRDLDVILKQTPEGILRSNTWLDMPAKQPPWVDSGIRVAAGESVSFFCAGRAVANKPLDLWFDPSLQIWCRVGDEGEVFRGTRNNHSFVAENSGPVRFANYFPSTWKTRQGALATDTDVYAGNSGDFRILVIVWRNTVVEGIRALLDIGDHPMLANELQRLEQGDITPRGWSYLWHLGPAEIFRAGETNEDHRPCMHCRTHADAGILQHEVDLPLKPETEISWRWRVDTLPSTIREDTLPSHDYMSLAIEFDNGRDITYYWSSSLPEGYGYDCPLPNWAGIEYHVVIRSGAKNLGEWLSERRNLYADYAHYMGEPPARITRVWFIAASVFQRESGHCDYSDIEIHDSSSRIRIL